MSLDSASAAPQSAVETKAVELILTTRQFHLRPILFVLRQMTSDKLQG